MQREQIPIRLAALRRWLNEETAANRVQAILDAFSAFPADETRKLLRDLVTRRTLPVEARRRGLAMLIDKLDAAQRPELLSLAEQVEDGPVVVDLLAEVQKWPQLDSRQLLLRKLDSSVPDVRAAALDASAALQLTEAARRIPKFLADSDARVRRAAAAAAGKLGVKQSAAVLLAMAKDGDPAIRAPSLESLRLLGDARGVPAAVMALEHEATVLPAIEYLAEFGAPEQADALAAAAVRNRSIAVLAGVIRALAVFEARESPDSEIRHKLASSIADVQGRSGALLRWQEFGPLSAGDAARFIEQNAPPQPMPSGGRAVLAAGSEMRTALDDDSAVQRIGGSANQQGRDAGPIRLAMSDIRLAEPTRAQFLASDSRSMQIWVNGRNVYPRGASRSQRAVFEADLAKGLNRVAVQVNAGKSGSFQLNFRPLGSSAEHEQLMRFALENNGNAERGRQVFADAEKSLCAKCHRIGPEGNTIGPDLTGVGARFSRIHLVESLLEPSRTIAPSYETLAIVLASGQVVSGVKIAENETTITLGDEKGQPREIRKEDIDERSRVNRSTMPEGLEKRLTRREFLDLVAYLVSLSATRARSE
jgi:putative heme-binding domain-containing protein